MAELVQERGAELHRYGFLLCGDRMEAADLVQEALVRVFSRPRRAWELGEAEAYVRRTMLNRYLDLHRRRARWIRALPRLVSTAPVADHSTDVMHRIDLMDAMRGLSPRQRACVVLRYYEDLSTADIAARLGCGEGTVKRHLSDALARLGARLRTRAHHVAEERLET
ncbi:MULTISPECIES: sigma-70 family RNA polymerase sigma factor [Streptomyces]|uniref:Sigma-70 family RNA polymerase sigma factor n=1 Tax=Streptomyces bugieae TaxID=3098223 RepID=A0ABU7NP33_9ACTN|nr:sigma-70 family RNA polymerase sigma factor [Streptomyces nigrescens]MEE4420647.1 sigma-70 family RNA polymerase sigma factor [Streptomyces sp. DSM 41528]